MKNCKACQYEHDFCEESPNTHDKDCHVNTATNTPTSKCCSKCSGDFDGKGCTMENGCPCHTPTTDSKNSSEDWEKEFDKFLYDEFGEGPVEFQGRKLDATYRWVFCADTPQQIEIGVYDCACCLDGGVYAHECACVCHKRIAQLKSFVRSQIQQAEAKGYHKGFKQGRFDTKMDAQIANDSPEHD